MRGAKSNPTRTFTTNELRYEIDLHQFLSKCNRHYFFQKRALLMPFFKFFEIVVKLGYSRSGIPENIIEFDRFDDRLGDSLLI